MAYKYFASGYLVKEGKALLVHHKKFDKWTPPGGHMEEDETPDQTLIREWKEELALDIEVLPAYENAFRGDANSTPIPMPFHIDLEREGFDIPRIGFFFYVKLKNNNQIIDVLKSELHDAQWFSKEDVLKISTFDQTRALLEYAINHYPKI
ncbi:MAG: NUDIX hydrolase [Candidatus Paceibacterota bacterium]